jgi:hypothetical protein
MTSYDVHTLAHMQTHALPLRLSLPSLMAARRSQL